MDREAFASACAAMGLPLSDEQLDKFAAFEEALYAANEVMNLTRVSREDCAVRHFLDSLLLHDLLPQGAHVLDIGTGPGFPSWPLACARPDLSIVTMDSSGKMLGFLRQHLLPNLETVQSRAEDSGVRESFDVVTGRALAPLSVQLELSAQPCRKGGAVIPMRTTNDMREIERLRTNPLGFELERVIEKTLPVIDAPRIFPVFRKVSTTPRSYPRKWAEIKSDPI